MFDKVINWIQHFAPIFWSLTLFIDESHCLDITILSLWSLSLDQAKCWLAAAENIWPHLTIKIFGMHKNICWYWPSCLCWPRIFPVWCVRVADVKCVCMGTYAHICRLYHTSLPRSWSSAVVMAWTIPILYQE